MIEDGILVPEVIEDFLVGEDDMMQLEIMVSLSVLFSIGRNKLKDAFEGVWLLV